MNQIAALLPAANVVLDADVADKAALFARVGAMFESNSRISAATVANSLAAREKLGSTGLGQGIAIPHGRLRGLSEAQGAFLRLAKPISFEAPSAIRRATSSSRVESGPGVRAARALERTFRRSIGAPRAMATTSLVSIERPSSKAAS
mgnify:CR=1 FL=1